MGLAGRSTVFSVLNRILHFQYNILWLMRHRYFLNHSLGSLLQKERRQNRMARPAEWALALNKAAAF
jgi:hypothetical protein